MINRKESLEGQPIVASAALADMALLGVNAATVGSLERLTDEVVKLVAQGSGA